MTVRMLLLTAGKSDLRRALSSTFSDNQRAHAMLAVKFAVDQIRTIGPIAVLMVLLCNGSAQAQAQANRGTAEQRAACAQDAFRLCLSSIPDASKIERCLRERISDLSGRCRSAFELPTSVLIDAN